MAPDKYTSSSASSMSYSNKRDCSYFTGFGEIDQFNKKKLLTKYLMMIKEKWGRKEQCWFKG